MLTTPCMCLSFSSTDDAPSSSSCCSHCRCLPNSLLASRSSVSRRPISPKLNRDTSTRIAGPFPRSTWTTASSRSSRKLKTLRRRPPRPANGLLQATSPITAAAGECTRSTTWTSTKSRQTFSRNSPSAAAVDASR